MAQFLCLSNDDGEATYINVEAIRAIEVASDATVTVDFGDEQRDLDSDEGTVLLEWLGTVTVATTESRGKSKSPKKRKG